MKIAIMKIDTKLQKFLSMFFNKIQMMKYVCKKPTSKKILEY